MRRILVPLFAIALATSAVPTLAAARSPRQPSGTWTFTDITPDPSNTGSGPKCSTSATPPAPADVNTYEVKVTKKRATLTTTSHNELDWTAEVQDSNGNVIATADGAEPNVKENLTLLLKKGTYTVFYCNWAGEPQITVDYTLK